jgi:hypothetical protein
MVSDDIGARHAILGFKTEVAAQEWIVRIDAPPLLRNPIAIVDLDQCAVRPACYGRLMSPVLERRPGDPAPDTGHFEEYDVPGNPTVRPLRRSCPHRR